jgi:hypothetical protein
MVEAAQCAAGHFVAKPYSAEAPAAAASAERACCPGFRRGGPGRTGPGGAYGEPAKAPG